MNMISPAPVVVSRDKLLTAEPSGQPEFDFDLSGFDYPQYELHFGGLVASAAGALGVRVKTAGTWRTASYLYSGQIDRSDATHIGDAATANGFMPAHYDLAAGSMVNGMVAFDAAGAYRHKFFLRGQAADGSSRARTDFYVGAYNAAEAVEAVRVLVSAGTLSGGGIVLEGVVV